ncbi:sulfatase family protein [Pontiella desulfatans]|nr:sulfatase [Pontiella desulfatans]
MNKVCCSAFRRRVSLGLVCFAGLLWNGQAAERPNILWITMEDTSPHFIGCYGDKNARTPNIDRLAREGVRFTRAFATGAVCSSSRSTIFTGERTYEMGTGNHRSAYPIPDYIKGFPYYMKEVGYFTSNCGKKDYAIADRERKKHEAWTLDGVVGWWDREDDRPFFCVFNQNDSHQSRTMSKPFDWYEEAVLKNLGPEQIVRDDQFEMPPFLKDSPEMRKQFARVYNSIQLTDKKIGELLKRLEDDGLRDDTIIFLYADHGEGIPRGKQNGINLAYQVPFIISVPEKWKHLSPWGKPGSTTDELVSFEDLGPTLISLAGGTIPEHMNGRILMGENRSKPTDHLILSANRSGNGIDVMRAVTHGDYFYTRNFMAHMPEERFKTYSEISEIMQQMRDDLGDGELNELQKSLFIPRPPEFLFNIKADPWETKNLASDPAHKERLQKMRQQLKKEIISKRDVMLLPEYEIDLISKEGTAYEFRLDDKNYPIREIYAAASLSGFRGVAVTKKQVSLLKSPNRFVRYWAAMGLFAQSKQELAPYEAEIAAAMNDTYPPAGATVAAVMWKNFETNEAEQKVKEYLQFDHWLINLRMVNYLFYIDNRALFVDAIDELRERTIEGVAKAEKEFKQRVKNVRNACDIFSDIREREAAASANP